MRCSSFSTARGYDFKKRELLHLAEWDLKDFRDALYFSKEERHLFIFYYGCVVFWNFTPAEEEDFLKRLKFISDRSFAPDCDIFEYETGEEQKVFQDLITLDKNQPLDMQMLAVSFGLSQSQALSYFENSVNAQIEDTKFIAQDMAIRGNIGLSRRDISKKMGAVMVQRNSVNLHTDILDTPAFVWDHPEYDELYQLTLSDLEFRNRTEVLNSRMSILKDLFEVMGNEVHNRHSAALEWIIIILISVEVVLTLLIDVFKIIG